MSQEYPRHMHRPGGEFKVVQNDAEKQAALKDGWYLSPDEAEASADDRKKSVSPKKG